jgi:FkbH-like protein
MPGATALQAARTLRKEGRVPAALELLRTALARNELDAETVDQAGRFIRREWGDGRAPRDVVRVLLLGQCTTSWVAHSLVAIAWGGGAALAVTEGEYDSVMQSLMGTAAEGLGPGIAVLLPWNQRLFSGGPDRSPQERIDEEVEFWRQAWDLCTQRLGARIVQVGYDGMGPGPAGYHLGGLRDGQAGLAREVSRGLRQLLPAGSFFVDLEQVAGMMGRERFYDPRRYYWTKQPFSEGGAVRLAEHLWAGVRALAVGPKKVLVVDLDNTLWGGVVGEAGPLGIALGDSPDGEAFRALQMYLKGLADRGILLAVASKNNPEDAREPFEKNPDMVLRLDDFAAFEASWDPKGLALERIAKALNLTLDSFVFLDDNPAEREQVRQALRDVGVVELPPEPADYVWALEHGLWFEAAAVTEEDRERTTQYRAERRRRESQDAFTSMEDYWRSLEMRGRVKAIDEADLQRVEQLLAKTNQFNLTTRRHGAEEVRRLLDRPGSLSLTLRLADKFGDHGLVSVVIAVLCPGRGPNALRVDTWLMSCRVIARTVEHYLFGELLRRARALGYERLLGEFIPTKKNALVKDLYPELGFTRLQENGDSSLWYELAIGEARAPATFIIPDGPDVGEPGERVSIPLALQVAIDR